MRVRSLVVLPLLILASCFFAAPERSKKVLEDAGYSDVKVGGYALYACGEDDFYSTEFSAVNNNGRPVNGAVCCGLVTKSCTIRFD